MLTVLSSNPSLILPPVKFLFRGSTSQYSIPSFLFFVQPNALLPLGFNPGDSVEFLTWAGGTAAKATVEVNRLPMEFVNGVVLKVSNIIFKNIGTAAQFASGKVAFNSLSDQNDVTFEVKSPNPKKLNIIYNKNKQGL